MIEDDDTAVLFEVPQKKNTDKLMKSNDIRCYKTMSQRIDENIKLEETQKNGISEETDSKDTKHCQSASQMIDDESMDVELYNKQVLSPVCSKAGRESNMDLNECVGDVSSFSLIYWLLIRVGAELYMKYILQLSTIDFDDGNMDIDFSSSVSNVKPQKNDTNVQNATCKTSVKDIKVGNAVDLSEVTPKLVKTKDEVEVFRFYYLDAYENPFKNPGTVYLFGKTYVPSHDMYCSCCVMVHCIPRRIYLLPRKYVCIIFSTCFFFVSLLC